MKRRLCVGFVNNTTHSATFVATQSARVGHARLGCHGLHSDGVGQLRDGERESADRRNADNGTYAVSTQSFDDGKHAADKEK